MTTYGSLNLDALYANINFSINEVFPEDIEQERRLRFTSEMLNKPIENFTEADLYFASNTPKEDLYELYLNRCIYPWSINVNYDEIAIIDGARFNLIDPTPIRDGVRIIVDKDYQYVKNGASWVLSPNIDLSGYRRNTRCIFLPNNIRLAYYHK